MKKRFIAILTAVMMLMTCTAVCAETITQTAGTATVQGFGGEITVSVVLEDGNIISVEMSGDGETAGIGSKILEEWPAAFVEYNGMENAGVNPDDYLRELADDETSVDMTIETDIAVIGAGGAGMVAALTASDAGKSVLVLESQPAVGGNSVKSTGGMNAAKTEWQDANEFGENAGLEKTLATAAEKYADNEAITALAATVKEQWEAWQAAPEGYFDSPELFALDTLIGGKGLNDPELVNTLVNGEQQRGRHRMAEHSRR